MTFKTHSGLVYEVDHAASHVRRLSNAHAPTSNQGADGTWRKYHSAFIELGYPAYFQWNAGSNQSTITSCVVEVDGAKLQMD